jgi:PEGA domain
LKTRDAFRAQLIAGLVASSLVTAPFAYAQKPKGGAPAAAASADKPLDKKQLADAKKHYGDGVTKYTAGDFAGALVDFQAADGVKQTPQTARYIGLCLDKLGRFDEALTAYNRFLGDVPAKMAAQGDEIKARVAAIQQLPGKLHVTSDPAASAFSIDGKPAASPTPTDVDIPPGHHTLHFSAAGHDPVDKDVDVTYASRQDVNATLPVSAPPPPPVAIVSAPPPPAAVPPPPITPPPPPAPHSNTAAWITGGAAVVAVGVGTAFGVMALNDKSNFNSNPTTQTADNGENHALIADMAFGVAITLGVTSLVLFLSRDDAPGAPTALAAHSTNEAKADRPSFTIIPSPIVTAHGAGAGATVQF